jgi:hypothetical protein
MIKNRIDFAAGLIFVGVGLLYGMMSLRLSLGSALEMGPGYFPLVLCGLLVALGAAILITSFSGGLGETFGKVPWRAVIMLPLAIIAFGAGLKYLGLLPSVFVGALLASNASGGISVARRVAISLSLAIFCTLVFSYGVNLHIPVLGTWFVN